MRLLVINPNISESVSELIGDEARRAASPGTEITMLTAPFGVAYIETRFEALIGALRGRHARRRARAGPRRGDHRRVRRPGGAGNPRSARHPGRRHDRGGARERLPARQPVLDRRHLAAHHRVVPRKRCEHNGLISRLASIRSLDRPLRDIGTVQADHAARLRELCTAVVDEDGADVDHPRRRAARRARADASRARLPVPVVDGVSSAVQARRDARRAEARDCAGRELRPAARKGQCRAPRAVARTAAAARGGLTRHDDGRGPRHRRRYGAWNPGIQSDMPWPLLPLATIFRPENAFTGFHEVHELAHLTGLAVDELVDLPARAARGARAPDPRDCGPVGARRPAAGGSRHRVPPHGADDPRAPHRTAHGRHRRRVRDAPGRALGPDRRGARAGIRRGRGPRGAATAARPQAGGLLGRFRRAGRKPEPAHAEDDWAREERIVREWSAGAQARDHPLRRAACRALARVASAVRAQHGRLWGDRSLLAPIAARPRRATTTAPRRSARSSSRTSGAAAAAEGYRAAARPGAAGRDEHEGRVRVGQEHDAAAAAPPRGRARRALERLRRWSAPTSGASTCSTTARSARRTSTPARSPPSELAIVDQKLDRYMARKAERGGHVAPPDRPVPLRQLRARLGARPAATCSRASAARSTCSS